MVVVDMRKITALLVICAIVLTACHQSIPKPQEEEPKTVEQTTEKLGKGQWTWHLNPSIECEGIWYCWDCGFSLDVSKQYYDSTFIDNNAMPILGDHGGHGGGYDLWVYDEALDLFGYTCGDEGGSAIEMYPFSEYFDNFSGSLKVVYRVDSTKRDRSNYDEDGEYFNEAFPNDAFFGDVAVFYNGEFVTDFIYSKGTREVLGENHAELVIVIDENGKYGAIGIDGEVWIEFIFDSLYIIDNYTAFAKQDGLWGIIALNGTVPENRGRRVPEKVQSGRINSVWQVVEESGKYAIIDNDGNMFVDAYFDSIENHGNGNFKCYFYEYGTVYNIRDLETVYIGSPMALRINYITHTVRADKIWGEVDYGIYDDDLSVMDTQGDLIEKAIEYVLENDKSVKTIRKIVAEPLYDFLEHYRQVGVVKLFIESVDSMYKVKIVRFEKSGEGDWEMTVDNDN